MLALRRHGVPRVMRKAYRLTTDEEAARLALVSSLLDQRNRMAIMAEARDLLDERGREWLAELERWVEDDRLGEGHDSDDASP